MTALSVSSGPSPSQEPGGAVPLHAVRQRRTRAPEAIPPDYLGAAERHAGRGDIGRRWRGVDNSEDYGWS